MDSKRSSQALVAFIQWTLLSLAASPEFFENPFASLGNIRTIFKFTDKMLWCKDIDLHLRTVVIIAQTLFL